MAQLESFLVDFLAREKFNALMDAVSCRTLDFINAVLMEAGIALQALQMPQQELEKNITIFEQTLKRAESERRLIQDVLEGDKKRVTFFVEEQARDLQQEAGQFLKAIMNRGPVSRSCGVSSKAGIRQAWGRSNSRFFAIGGRRMKNFRRLAYR